MKKTLFVFLSCVILISIIVSAQKVTFPLPKHGAHGPKDNEISVFYDDINKPYVEHRGPNEIVIELPAFKSNTKTIQEVPQGIPEGPSGAVVAPATGNNNVYLPAFLLLIAICAFILITHSGVGLHSKIVFIIGAIVITILSIPLLTEKSQPTGLAIKEELQPEQLVNAGCFVVTIGLNSYTICPETECSDGIDNDDFEDTLIDCADPGCHSDGNASNPASCDPSDDWETDMLEYDRSPVVDNQIDVYDIVGWIRYFNADYGVLTHCTTPTCTNQIGAAHCVGDVDPDGNLVLNGADIAFLQATQLADTDSRTIPICFNPT